MGFAYAQPTLRRAPQRRRLLIEHRLDRRPRRCAVEAVALHQVLAIGEDGVGVLHQLQPLEAVFVVQAHAQADDLVQIENLERKVALVGAELAVVGVVERDQRVDMGRLGGLELGFLQRAAMGRQRL